jgi:hypothetical protein
MYKYEKYDNYLCKTDMEIVLYIIRSNIMYDIGFNIFITTILLQNINFNHKSLIKLTLFLIFMIIDDIGNLLIILIKYFKFLIKKLIF